MTRAEDVELGPNDSGLCSYCREGVCHWEPGLRAAFGRALDRRCTCPRHMVSVYARAYCLAVAPHGLFAFVAVCRRTKGHVTPGHCDTWREVVWGG